MSLLTMPVRFCSDLCSMFVLLSLCCWFWLMIAGWLRRRERAGHLALVLFNFEALPGVLGIQGEGLFIFRDLGRRVIFRDLGRKHNFLGF